MKKTWLLIFFLWLVGVVAGMQFAKFSSTITLIQGEVGIDSLYSGWLLPSLGIIGIVFGVTSGVIVSRFSPIKMVIIFLWWAAATSILQVIFVRPEALLVVRILEGFSQLILVSAAPTALLQVAPKRYQTMVMTLWGTFFGVAFLIMHVLQGPLIDLGGWRAIFYAHAIFAVIVAVTLTLFLKTNPADSSDSTTSGTSQNAQVHEKRSFIAQLEIKHTAEEAVREAVAKLSSELICEKSLRESWEGEALRLETIATRMKDDLVQAKKQRNLLQKIAIGEGLLILGMVARLVFFGLQ